MDTGWLGILVFKSKKQAGMAGSEEKRWQGPCRRLLQLPGLASCQAGSRLLSAWKLPHAAFMCVQLCRGFASSAETTVSYSPPACLLMLENLGTQLQ
jgi:hypothetical protein